MSFFKKLKLSLFGLFVQKINQNGFGFTWAIQPMTAPTGKIFSLNTSSYITGWKLIKSKKIIENNHLLIKIIYKNEMYYKKKIEYKFDDKYHRINGAAVIIYENDKIIEEQYWIEGKQISNELVEQNPTILTDSNLRKILS